jgi:hypothetical protein
MPLIETKGAASAQGFGEFLQQSAPIYIENVFSTYLYTGNASSLTITNGIDLSGKGGLTWIKDRQNGTIYHRLMDTVRGASWRLASNRTDAQSYDAQGVTSFNSNGFSLGNSDEVNAVSNYVSWTFRKQPKFFDVVTYTGTGSAGMINHNLGSTPGMIIYKSTSLINNWCVYHRSISPTSALFLNLTIAQDSGPGYFGSQSATATQFPVGNNDLTNQNGQTYVAYLFAHDAGGFGLTGTDNVISCGTFTTDGTGKATVTLGYEPQWIIAKRTNSAGDWYMADVMRGMPVGSATSILTANLSAAEYSSVNFFSPTATGFLGSSLDSSAPFIYIAIRRGPMKVPTSGTSVFTPATRTGTGSGITTTAAGFPVDTYFVRRYPYASFPNDIMDRLRGSPSLVTNSTGIESTGNGQVTSWAAMSGVGLGSDGETNSGIPPDNLYVDWYFRRAPGFFDVVCYTGDGTTNRAIAHNLTVIPELIINKPRSYADFWEVYQKDLGVNSYIYLNSTNANGSSAGNWSSMTASAFGAGYAYAHNRSGYTYVAYLFATCPGVSKVGSYTGTGALQTINCGFTGGARWVMIKRTDSTGDWYVYDSARGISSGTDPYLALNSNAAQVTGTNYVDTTSVGFQVTAAAPAGLNANGGTYIFLAIA